MIIKYLQKNLSISIFIFFFTIFLMTSGGHTDSTDGVTMFLVAENFAMTGVPAYNANQPSADKFGLDVEKTISFHAWNQIIGKSEKIFGSGWNDNPERREYVFNYTDNAIKGNFFGPAYLVLPIISAPLYLIFSSVGLPVVNYVPLLVNPIIIAITTTSIFLISKELFYSERIGFVTALIFGISTFLWPYITSFWTHPLAIMFFTLGFFLIIRKNSGTVVSFLAGLTLGLAVLSHPLFLIQVTAITIFGITQFWKNKKSIMLFLIALTIMILVQTGINEYRFGDVSDFGFGTSLTVGAMPSGIIQSMINSIEKGYAYEGIFGLFFSPGNSIFVYMPIFVLTPIGWYYMYKKNKRITILFIFLTIYMIIHVGHQDDWNENPNWGPHRYLLPIIPFCVIPIGVLLMKFSKNIRLKTSVIILSVSGFIVNLLGNLVWPQYAFSYGWGGPPQMWRIEATLRPDVFTWDPNQTIIIFSIRILMEDWVSTLPTFETATDYFKIGLNGCTYDLFLYCQFGLVPLIILGIVLSIVGFIIISKLKHIESIDRKLS